MKVFTHKNLKSQYKMLMDNTCEMIIFFDSHGRVSGYNKQAAKELGCGEELSNLLIYNIFRKAFSYLNQKLTLDTKYRNGFEETIAYRKNETCFPVELKISYIQDGITYKGLCSAVSIADKKEADREIRSLKEEINSFNQHTTQLMAGVTHELRTPINGIAGFSNNLLNTGLNPEQREAVNIIKRCCINMNMIINDLLDYAKISENNIKLECREFNFRDVIQQVIDFNKIRINEKGLKLLVDISDDIPELLVGDELRLVQILNNLFSNAVKFTTVGHIGLEVTKISEIGQYIELFFILFDTGIGISIEDRDKLFKDFSQVDSSISRRFGGTGLGLSLSKKMIETMGGSIKVDSEKNKGSVFSFSIKLIQPSSVSLTRNNEAAEGLQEDGGENADAWNETRYNLTVSEIDYISKRLREANYTTLKNTYTREMMAEALKDAEVKLEKLIICIEMENWELAEELAFGIKGLIPKEHIDPSKNALRLLLSVRKENHDTSLEIIKILQEGLHKGVPQ